MEHDLHTPFLGFQGLNKYLHHLSTDPEQKEILEVMITSNNHWIKAVDSILAVSRANKKFYHLEFFSIRDLLTEIEHLMSAAIKAKKFWLKITCRTKEIYTDCLRLFHILINLVRNAIQFTKQGGVTLDVTFIPDLQIIIKDTGISIPPEHIPSLFDKFTKVKPSNRNGDIFEGAVLGLYIAQEYA